ncbi:DUF5681 domain-containing protein [Henriciella sp.]|uniref:DUF5681 domain-containing protein n=1 Tax=Henriciella sp. TaxID=1968823 RepID=UPI002601EB96|nr:DUF5681 domain-containing protein [Henriciella sp.]
MTSKKNGDYEIGYSKTPKHTRFKPGQSGNPKGRPKGTPNYKTELLAELSQEVEYTENGQRKTSTKLGLMLKTLANKAATGDPRSIALVIAEMSRLMPDDDRSDSQPLSPADQSLIDVYVRRRAAELEEGDQDDD